MQLIPEPGQRPQNLSWVFKERMSWLFEKCPVVTWYSRIIVIVLYMISISLQSQFKDIIVLNSTGFPDCKTPVLQSFCVQQLIFLKFGFPEYVHIYCT